MSSPKVSYKSKTYGAIMETNSAITSLNMEPSPLESPTGPCLSERDYWARHAMEHLKAAQQLAVESNVQSCTLVGRLEYILDVQWGIERPPERDDAEDWCIEALSTVMRKLRKEHGRS